jgi:hypothetical protein
MDCSSMAGRALRSTRLGLSSSGKRDVNIGHVLGANRFASSGAISAEINSDGDVGPALGVARLATMAVSHDDAAMVFAKPHTLDIAEPLPGDRELSESRLARWSDTFKLAKDVGT